MSRAAKPFILPLTSRHSGATWAFAQQSRSPLGVDHTSVLPPTSPLFGNIDHGQIQHFQQAVIGGKDRFGFGHLAQLAVKAISGISGIDQPAVPPCDT